MSKFLEASPLTAFTNALFGFATRAFAGGLTTVPALVAWPGYALATIVIMMVSGMVSPISTTGFDSSNALGIIIAALVVLSLLLGSASLLRRWTTSHWGIETGALGGVFRLIGEANRGLRRTLIFAAGTVLGAAIISALAPNFRSFTAGVVYIAVLVIAAMLAIIITLAGRPHRGTAGVPMSVEDPLFTSLSAIFGQRNNDWIPGRVEVYENSQIRVTPPSASGTWLANLTANVALHLSDWEVREASAAQVVLVPLSEATRDNRELVARSAGLVTAVRAVPGSIGTGKTNFLRASYNDMSQRAELEQALAQSVSPDTTVYGFPVGPWTTPDGERVGKVEFGPAAQRPTFYDAESWTLAPGAKAAVLEVRAREVGKTVVRFDAAAHHAVVAQLDPNTTRLRTAFATSLKCEPWDVEVALHWAESERTGKHQLASIDVVRYPEISVDDVKRLGFWRDVAKTLPGSWKVSEDAFARTVRLTSFFDCTSESMLLADFEAKFRADTRPPTESFKNFAVAYSDEGEPVSFNLFHTLIAGQTGAGKGSVLWSVMSGLMPAMREGLVELYGIDPKASEAKMAPNLFKKLAMNADDWTPLLEEMAADLGVRQLARVGRNFEISTSNPLRILFIDELAAVTALDTDPKRRAKNIANLTVILSQGRSDGTLVVAAVQAPHKEVLGQTRNFFGARVALRTDSALETDMLLGAGAAERGADAHLIPVANEGNSYISSGIGYMAAEGMAGNIRVRFPFTNNAQLSGWNDEFAGINGGGFVMPVSPGQKRVVLPKPDQSVFNLWDAEQATETAPPAPATPPVPLRPPGAPGALK